MENEQSEDEQTTMQREWLELQRKRFDLDIERDRLMFDHISRQTEAMERMTLAVNVLVDLIVIASRGKQE